MRTDHSTESRRPVAARGTTALIRAVAVASAALAVMAVLPAVAQAQAGEAKTFYACYVPGTGTVYRIMEAGLPAACGKTGQKQHVEFNWTEGGSGDGVVGPQGPEGPQGPAGEPGTAGPTAILTTATFDGSVGGMAGWSGLYVFAGPSVQITTTEMHQRVTGSASAVLGLTTGAPGHYADVGICHQSAAGGILTNFTGSNFQINYFTATRQNYATSASKILAPGTYNVGMCVRNNGGGTTMNNNTSVSGWVLVTR